MCTHVGACVHRSTRTIFCELAERVASLQPVQSALLDNFFLLPPVQSALRDMSRASSPTNNTSSGPEEPLTEAAIKNLVRQVTAAIREALPHQSGAQSP